MARCARERGREDVCEALCRWQMHRIGMLEADVLHRKRRLHPLRDAHERFIALEADNPAAGMKERDTEGFAPIAGAHP